MLLDARGVPVTTISRAALDLYEQALWQYHSYFGDPIATIDRALAADPGFVLGHVFRATALLMMTERRFATDIRRSLEAAEANIDRANDRERLLLSAAGQWLDGDLAGAARGWDQLLEDHPRDAFALQSAHLTDFYLGDAANLRDRIARVLGHWDADLPSYSYVLGMYAFGLEETGAYERAEETGRRALEIEPRDGWAVHAVTHVMEMQSRVDEGIDWLSSRRANWAPDNGFAFHNWWHLALYHLDLAQYDEALALYDTQIYPQPSDVSLQMIDASALLWRLRLLGVDVGQRWHLLADQWERKSAAEDGYYAFNDFHALLAYLAAGRDAAVERTLAALERAAEGHGTNAIMSREVGVPLARAFIAFERGRYDRAIELLAPVRLIANRFGGSHAQRDLLNQTLIEATLRDGRQRLAANLINERIELKPHSPLAWRLRARVQKAGGDLAGAEAAAAHAERLKRREVRVA